MNAFSPGGYSLFSPGELTCYCNILAEEAFNRRSRTIDTTHQFLGKRSSFGKVSSFKKRSDARRGILLKAESSHF
jgi:hypothetical protein